MSGINLIVGGILGMIVLVALRGLIVIVRRGDLPAGWPTFGGVGLIGMLLGMSVTLYAFPGGDWQEAMGKMTAVDSLDELHQTLKESRVPVVVDVYSPTCPACKVVAPRLGELADRFGGRVKFIKVNGTSAEDILTAYTVIGYPTVLLFAPGQTAPAEHWLGIQETQEFASRIQAVLDRAGQGESDERNPTMQKRTGVITFKGEGLTLVGDEVKVGDQAPDFTAVGNDLSPVKLSDFSGQVVVISAVPSLDTPVCDTQTRTFNEKVAGLDGVKVLTVSADLPFAQARWCGAAGVENVITVSDYKDHDFAKSYGMLVEELALVARGVFVVDSKGKIAYIELVNEVTDEPDYDAALAAVKKLLN